MFMIISAVLAFVVAAVVTALSGAGMILFLVLETIICVLLGLGMVMKMLAKSMLPAVKLLLILSFLAVPLVNIAALILVGILTYKKIGKQG
ncbi:MAG: hypothetical protein ACI4KF_01080 [Huintestinicola sp.]